MHRIGFLSALLILLATTTGAVFAQTDWEPAETRLMTRWGEKVTPQNVWQAYPRPQMARDDWMNLNGLWQYAIQPRDAGKPDEWDGRILVPFAVESALSGVGKSVQPDQRLWYRRTFDAGDWPRGEELLLHFGAVDWEATVWINGEKVGEHRGGYDPFTIDISEAANRGRNELVVAVWDPTDKGSQPRGKQVLDPHGIWYTAVTGIWQTAWLETVPETHVQSLEIVPDLDASAARITIHGANEAKVRLEATSEGRTLARATGETASPIKLAIDQPKLWSPDSPHLYDLTVQLIEDDRVVDEVDSYFAMREISVQKDEKGVNRLFLNGKPLFHYGPLDQGWWPDGLYTAPSDEALKYDLLKTRELGFNMVRKHVKVEPARWYYWADKLGLLVWQDMPSGGAHPDWHRRVDVDGPEIVRDAASKAQFRRELGQIIKDCYNHPSIVMWVPFNERWGQYNTERITSWVRRLDPTRVVNAASGGNYLGVGDVLDRHNYPDPVMAPVDEHMAVVAGEFGGLGLPIEGHTWQSKANWGYRSFDNKQALAEAYLNKLDMLRPMIAEGLAGAVYTQTTDVEIEVNGFMTYDRAVMKMPGERIREANQSLYDAGLSLETFMPTAPQKPSQWRYTTNKPSGDWRQRDFDAAGWQQGEAGFGHNLVGGGRAGTNWNGRDIWLRRTFTLDQVPNRLWLKINHDDAAEVYINGAPAAKLDGWTRVYTYAPVSDEAIDALRRGENVIAIHCHQDGGGQYIDAGLVGTNGSSE